MDISSFLTKDISREISKELERRYDKELKESNKKTQDNINILTRIAIWIGLGNIILNYLLYLNK